MAGSFAIVGTGASLRGFDLRFPADVTVIGVNAAIHILPRCDVWFTLDPAPANQAIMARPQPGVRYVAAVPDDYEPRLAHVTWLRRVAGEGFGRYRVKTGLSPETGAIHTGNSGWGALQLAVQMGAERIALFGMDVQGRYVTGGMPRYLSMMPMLFSSAVEELARRNIAVVNGSPSSLVDCFPRMSPQQAREWLTMEAGNFDIVSGVRLISDGDMVVKAAKDRGGFETDSLALWRRAAASGRQVIDVGAYTGVYAIRAAMNGARVIAFEPSDGPAERLQENARLNGVTVDLRRMAAWKEQDRLTLRGGKRQELTSARSVVSGRGAVIGEVEAVALDDAVTGKVAAIKIDAERAEPQVIEGALRIIRESRPLLLVEELDAASGAAVAALLEPLGYRRQGLSQCMTAWHP